MGVTVPVGAAVLDIFKDVIVEPVFREPVPVVTTTVRSKGNVFVTKPPIEERVILPEMLEVAVLAIPA